MVQRIEADKKTRLAVRSRIAQHYDRTFRNLVVTQLGAGVAADRGAQIQAVCGMMERRSDVLHLVVCWPTGVVQPSWLQWSKTRVVRTHHAATLAAAADLSITAAGYNSFHEALYNRVPSLFIPQTGGFMDDQTARAEAACERGLAAMVEPSNLMALERETTRILDEGAGETFRSAMDALDLPETGNRAAARLIEETQDGNTALDRHPVADRSAGY